MVILSDSIAGRLGRCWNLSATYGTFCLGRRRYLMEIDLKALQRFVGGTIEVPGHYVGEIEKIEINHLGSLKISIRSCALQREDDKAVWEATWDTFDPTLYTATETDDGKLSCVAKHGMFMLSPP
ncbi:MAG: hypothetical protein JWN90_37 [Parcubacteria group bacterium]|nr:hypothetical protein [Parcubacteria group bacterium]